MTAWWTDLADPESAIKTVRTRLLSSGASCTAGDNLTTTIVDWVELSPNSTDYQFLGVSLRVRFLLNMLHFQFRFVIYFGCHQFTGVNLRVGSIFNKLHFHFRFVR